MAAQWTLLPKKLLQSTGYLLSFCGTHRDIHGVDTGIKPFLTLLEALQNVTH